MKRLVDVNLATQFITKNQMFINKVNQHLSLNEIITLMYSLKAVQSSSCPFLTLLKSW